MNYNYTIMNIVTEFVILNSYRFNLIKDLFDSRHRKFKRELFLLYHNQRWYIPFWLLSPILLRSSFDRKYELSKLFRPNPGLQNFKF